MAGCALGSDDTTASSIRHTSHLDLQLILLNHGEARDQECSGAGGESGGIEDPCQHPNIRSYMGLIRLPGGGESIGHLCLHICDKLYMDSTSSNQMWQESQAYDALHMGDILHKVENFIFNEEFSSERERGVTEAHAITFVEEVWLHPKSRGRDRELHALRMALLKLRLPRSTVVQLQAGSVGGIDTNVAEADEKLTAHWKRLGFEPWSSSDDSWLCLSLEDERYGYAAMPSSDH